MQHRLDFQTIPGEPCQFGSQHSLKQALVVYNPAARTAAHPDLWLGPIVHRLCDQCDVLVTTYPTRPERTYKDLIALLHPQLSVVIAAGGDGTVRNVLAALAMAGVNIPAGIIPLGTWNVLARSLGILKDSLLGDPLDTAITTIMNGEQIRMDLGLMNGHCFALAAGVGAIADAFVIPDRRDKTSWKILAYYSELIKTITNPPRTYRIKADDQSFLVTASGIFVSNTQDLGIGKMADRDDLIDGQLYLCIVAPREFNHFVTLGFNMLAGLGELSESYYVRKVRTVDIDVVPIECMPLGFQEIGREVVKHITGKRPDLPVKCDKLRTMVDGDPCGTTPMHVSVLPQAVNVIIPLLPNDQAMPQLSN